MHPLSELLSRRRSSGKGDWGKDAIPSPTSHNHPAPQRAVRWDVRLPSEHSQVVVGALCKSPSLVPR